MGVANLEKLSFPADLNAGGCTLGATESHPAISYHLRMMFIGTAHGVWRTVCSVAGDLALQCGAYGNITRTCDANQSEEAESRKMK